VIVLRRTSGSCLCVFCGKLNSVDARACFHCGRRNPGLWGFGPLVGRLVAEATFARVVSAVCLAAFVGALLLDPRAALRPRGVFGLLAPSRGALDLLGMTGAYAWAHGRWWTLLTAIYLHGGALHLLFNLLWIRQLAPAVEEIYGRSRLVLVFTAAGVLGFVASNAVGVAFTLGASGGIFGLLGALVAYGRSRGGLFGGAILRHYGQWALVLFALGFLMSGVNNFAHAGGFVGGYLMGTALAGRERLAGRDHLGPVAGATVLLTAIAFGLAVWTGFIR
jgi:rhomboid protease GluP